MNRAHLCSRTCTRTWKFGGSLDELGIERLSCATQGIDGACVCLFALTDLPGVNRFFVAVFNDIPKPEGHWSIGVWCFDRLMGCLDTQLTFPRSRCTSLLGDDHSTPLLLTNGYGQPHQRRVEGIEEAACVL